jgi:hypothetical protein
MNVGRACIAALAAVLTLACHGASSDKLEGRWIGVRAEGVSPDAIAAGNAFARGLELEFRRNEITIAISGEEQSGRYELVREDPSGVVIATDRDGPSHPQTFVFAVDETMRWALPEGKAIVFAKE